MRYPGNLVADTGGTQLHQALEACMYVCSVLSVYSSDRMLHALRMFQLVSI